MENKENKSPIQENSKSNLENKVLPILRYVGAIGASLMVVAYIVVVMVMIIGFKVQQTSHTIVFASVNAIVGLIITQFLKIQGISFAKEISSNKDILNKYYSTKTKDKKYLSINTYWIKSIIKDILFKATGIAITSAGLIYIVIQGSNDYNLLLLAIVNLIMFSCFGLLGLVSAYEFFNQRHIPYLIHQLEIAEEKPVVVENPARLTEVLLALENLKEKEILCLQEETEPNGETLPSK